MWYLYLSDTPFSHLEIVDGAIVALFASSLTDKCLPSLYFFPTYEIMTSTLLSSINLHLPDRGCLYKYTISKETHCKNIKNCQKNIVLLHCTFAMPSAIRTYYIFDIHRTSNPISFLKFNSLFPPYLLAIVLSSPLRI